MNELANTIIRGMTEQNSELDFRIKANTELYRKGFGRIHLKNPDGSPYTGKAEICLKLKQHEYRFGANLFMLDGFAEPEQNQQFEKVFTGLFNLGVIPFYWKDYEPEPGRYRFKKDCGAVYRRPPVDRCVEFCGNNHIEMKGHPLCWHCWLPDWLEPDRRKFFYHLEKFIAKTAECYADKIFVFDAINEVMEAAKNFNSPYPEDFVQKAFLLAQKYFPHAQLCLNDNKFWWTHQGKYSQFYLAAKDLINSGIKPGGLGMQMHCFSSYFPGGTVEAEEYLKFLNAENLYRMLDLYHTLNIPCNLSEVSIFARKDMLGEDGEEVQKIVTEKLYRLWFSHPATDGIIWWNCVDGTASGGENWFKAGLVREDFSLKPAGEAVRKLIHEEWVTDTSFVYDSESPDNRFHGFYGEYDVTVKTDCGETETRLKLSKHENREFNIKAV